MMVTIKLRISKYLWLSFYLFFLFICYPSYLFRLFVKAPY